MSTLNVDALVGNTSANAITVRGEGTATTSLQQGLAKCWANVDAENSTMGIFDSFNVSSVADGGNGKITVNINNNMSNTTYCFLFGVANGSGFDDDPTLNVDGSELPTTSVFKFYSIMNGSLNDARQGCMSINGDLA